MLFVKTLKGEVGHFLVAEQLYPLTNALASSLSNLNAMGLGFKQYLPRISMARTIVVLLGLLS